MRQRARQLGRQRAFAAAVQPHDGAARQVVPPRVLPLAQHVHRRRRVGLRRRAEHVEHLAQRLDGNLDLAARDVAVRRRHAPVARRRTHVVIKVSSAHGRYSGAGSNDDGDHHFRSPPRRRAASPSPSRQRRPPRSTSASTRPAAVSGATRWSGSGDVWLGRVEGVREGDRYGLRAHGPALDPSVLLVDPLARAVDGRWSVAVADVPATSAPLRRPWAETVIYEAHVRGFTRLHPGVPPALRGTYAGLAHPAAIAELRASASPRSSCCRCSSSATSEHLRDARRATTTGATARSAFCAPHAAYAASGGRGGQVAEFRALVAALHDAGIEVILDVVYNHTGRGRARRDRLVAARPRSRHLLPRARRDRHRQQPRRVQPARAAAGARLAAPLGDGVRRRRLPLRPRRHARPRRRRLRPRPPAAHRDGRRPRAGRHEADRRAVGHRARRLPRGRLPGPVRGVERRLPRRGARRLARTGHDGRPGARAWRARPTRSPTRAARWPASTSSPATTASRCTTWSRTTRSTTEANGEQNRDGDSHNRSWNSGVEGPTDDPAILEMRRRRAAAHARHRADSRRACR